MGYEAETTVWPIDDAADYTASYAAGATTGTITIDKTNFAAASSYSDDAHYPNRRAALANGSYFPVVRMEIDGEDYVFAYNPITIDSSGNAPAADKAPSITTRSLASTMVNDTYEVKLAGKTGAASGKAGEFSWAVTDGVLPQGLTLDGSTGTITGIPTQAGSYTFTITLTETVNGTARTANRSYTVRVLGEVTLGEISYDQSPLWADGSEHKVAVSVATSQDLSDASLGFAGSTATVTIHQKSGSKTLTDIEQNMTVGKGKLSGEGTVQADADAITGITVKLTLRDNDGNVVYRSTPNGEREPFTITTQVDDPSIPFGGQAEFPALDLSDAVDKGEEWPVSEARVRVWPQGAKPTADTVTTDTIDESNGTTIKLAEGTYVFTIEGKVAAAGGESSWIDIMGTSNEAKLVAGTHPKQYLFSVDKGATTTIDATFDLANIEYHNATVLFEDEDGAYLENLASWYDVSWYRRVDGKNVLVGTGDTVSLEESDDPLYVQVTPDRSDSATWDATKLVEVTGKNVTVKVARRPHFSVAAKLTFASGWKVGAGQRRGVIQVALPLSDGSYVSHNVWATSDTVTLDGITPGTVLTFTPQTQSMCGSVSYTVKDEGDTAVTLAAPHARGIVTFGNLTLRKADDARTSSDDSAAGRTSQLALNDSNTKVEVTRGTGANAEPVKFFVADESHLRILDDEKNLTSGARYTVTVTAKDYDTVPGLGLVGDDYAARASYTVTLADSGAYKATATVRDAALVARGAMAFNAVNRNGTYVKYLLYDKSGALLGSSWGFGTSSTVIRTPFLPAGSYTLFAVASSALDASSDDAVQTIDGLNVLTGGDARLATSVSFQVRNNVIGMLADDFVAPMGTSTGIVDSANSTVTATGSYGDQITVRIKAALVEGAQASDDASIELYTNQPSGQGGQGYMNPRALAINGKAIALNRWDGLFNQTQNMEWGRLTVKLSEARKAYAVCGEFPLDLSLVIPRTDASKTEVWAWLVSGGKRSFIGSFSETFNEVSLTAPTNAAWREFAVYGTAGPGATVDIALNGMQAATTMADEYGYYTAKLTLPDNVQDGDVFYVQATSSWTYRGTSYTATSEAQDVLYSTSQPAVERITMFYQDRPNTSYHAVKTYERGALTAKYLSIYRPENEWGSEADAEHAKTFFMVELANPQLASNVKVNVVRSDEDLVLDTTRSLDDAAAKIPDVKDYLRRKDAAKVAGASLLQTLSTSTGRYVGTIERNAAGDIVIRAIDAGSAFVTEPIYLSYAPDEVYATFGEARTEPQTVKAIDQYVGFRSAGVEASDLSTALTAINSSSYLKVVKASDDGKTMELADTTATGVAPYLAAADGNVSDWLAIGTGNEEDGWLKVRHTYTTTDTSSAEATRAITAGKAAAANFNKQLVAGNTPNVTYEGHTVIGAADAYANDPSNVYYILGQDGAGAWIDMMFQYNIGTTGRKLYTRITADKSGYTRIDWDESTGKRTQLGLTIDASQQDDTMDSYDMVRMWTWIHAAIREGMEEAANEMSMSQETQDAVLGLRAQSLPSAVISKSSSIKTKFWEALGQANAYDYMTPEEGEFVKAYLFDGSGDAKSMQQYYAEQGSSGGRDLYSELNYGWGVGGLKQLAESAVTGTSVPGKAELAFEGLYQAASARGKGGSVRYRAQFLEIFDQIMKDRDKAEKRDPNNPGATPANPDFKFPKIPPEIEKAVHAYRKAKKQQARRNAGKGANQTNDPSGIVYEAVLSNPVEGATVKLYTYNSAAGVAQFIDATKFNIEPNPQVTGEDGRYQWFVPEGFWQVRASKEGYQSFSTGNTETGMNYGLAATRDLDGDGADEADEYWMPVLPVQLDVNLPLVSLEQPTVKATEGDEDGVTVVFSKYMKVDTVAPEQFTVAGKVPARVEALDAEEAGDGSGEQLARTFKLYYADDVVLQPGKNLVPVTMVDPAEQARSYAGVAMAELPYEGEVEVTIKANIADATVAPVDDQTYTGKQITPKLALTYGGKDLVEGTDYTVSYEENVDAGTATVTITGIGAFTGTTSATFTINKAPSACTAPTPRDLVYNERDQALVSPGTTSDGTMAYSLSEDGPYVASVPTGRAAGTYTVWYRVLGDANHLDSEPQSVEVTIAEATIGYYLAKGDGQTHQLGTDDSLEFTFKRNVDDAETFSHFAGITVDGKRVGATSYDAKAGSVVVTLKAAYLNKLGEGNHELAAQFDDGNSPSASFKVVAAAAKDAKQKAAAPTGTLAGTGDLLNPMVLAVLVAIGVVALGFGIGWRRRNHSSHRHD